MCWSNDTGMNDKNKVFTIKSKTDKILQSSKTMKSQSKLIEVRFGHTEHSYTDGYGCDDTWTEYETVGFFDNIQHAWDLVQHRIDKYHTNIHDYSFNIIEVNPKAEKISDTVYEEKSLNEYYQDIEKEKQRKIDERTLGFRCSECKKIIKMSFNIQNDKTTHGQTKHISHGSWSHVNWTRIMKKGKGEKITIPCHMTLHNQLQNYLYISDKHIQPCYHQICWYHHHNIESGIIFL